MIIEIFEPMRREKIEQPSKIKKALYSYQGSYKMLTLFFIASLVTIWAECGYPAMHYQDGVLFMCAYDMAAHEMILKFIGVSV